jgi:anti-sigma regulatory factor (Ser/Thr protein kinase)
MSVLSLQFWNDLAVLDQNRASLRTYLESASVDAHAIHRVELAFDELVTNICRHGYADDLAHYIRVEIRVAGNHVAMIFDDDGREFDPVNAQLPDKPESIERAQPGGLGLLLLRRMSSEMRYERVGARNRTYIRIGIRTTDR